MIQNKVKMQQGQDYCDILQKDELYALQTIYLQDFEYIRQAHPYSIQVIVAPFVPAEFFVPEALVTGRIYIDLPIEYPLKTQRFEFQIQGLSKNFTLDMQQQATAVCEKVLDIYEREAEAQPIVFAVVEAFRDWVLDKSHYFQELYDDQNKKFDESALYIPPMPKFSTFTPVTIETFMAWKKKFDQEMYEQKRKSKQFLLQEELSRKISGKHFFDKKKHQAEELEDAQQNLQEDQFVVGDDDAEELSEKDYQDMEEEDEEDEEFQPLYEREQLE